MDATFQFLWDRRHSARNLHKSQEWAVCLLEQGHESDAILRLAGITDSSWHLERELVLQILHDIGQQDLLVEDLFWDEYERQIIADYYAGLMDGHTLLDQAIEIHYERDEPRRQYFWLALCVDAGQHGGQGLCHIYRFDLLPFDVALKQALAEHGFPEPPGV
ncbi:hypothetical protein NA78x_002319 [Anatilimnocola sp. NA78]|uniref:hypothetical protein n=1 Tax=Anatilimnocola sp. NA78 TaxID=3415683 RepID=UPI003CE51EA4